MNTRLAFVVILFLSLALPACAPRQSAIDTAVAQTLKISQLETAAAAGQATSQATSTETLAPPQTQTLPAKNAPDPLPASNTGIMLKNGECFNFDNGQVTAPNAECDEWLAEPALFRQMNGAQLSGYVTITAPTRGHCLQAKYESGDLALQTDLYMCFITNQGRAGFVVVRDYLGGIPSTGIIFDYWVFG